MTEKEIIEKHQEALEMMQNSIATYLKLCISDYSKDDDISFVNSEALGWAYEIARFAEFSLAADYKKLPEFHWIQIDETHWSTTFFNKHNSITAYIEFNKETNLYEGVIEGLTETMQIGCQPSTELIVVQNRLEATLKTWNNSIEKGFAK